MLRSKLSFPASPLALLLTMLLAGLLPAVATAQTDVSRRIAASADGVVTVSNVSGSIVVRGWERNEVEVTGTLGRSVEELEIDSSSGRIDIEVELPRRSHRDGDADLEIRVPRGSRVDLELVSARAAVSEVLGEVRIETVSGSIDVQGDARAIDVSSVSGEIEVRSRSRRIEAETVSGAIYLVEVSGEVEASSVSGAIEVDAAKVARLRLESVSGTIEVSATLAPRADVEIESHSGGVEVELPRDVSARFDVSTYSGRIRNELGPEARKVGRYTPESQLEFTIGSGDAQVRIETFSGRVILAAR